MAHWLEGTGVLMMGLGSITRTRRRPLTLTNRMLESVIDRRRQREHSLFAPATFAPATGAGPGRRRDRVAVVKELIGPQVTAVRIACGKMTAPHLDALRDSVDRACLVPATLGWNSKAAAHAEIFAVLAAGVNDPVVAPVLASGAGLAYDLMVAAGRRVDGMIAASRRRLLAHLLAGDTDAAAQEMEQHLSTLHFVWRLAVNESHRASVEARQG